MEGRERDEGQRINGGEGDERGTLRKTLKKEGRGKGSTDGGRLSCMSLWIRRGEGKQIDKENMPPRIMKSLTKQIGHKCHFVMIHTCCLLLQ